MQQAAISFLIVSMAVGCAAEDEGKPQSNIACGDGTYLEDGVCLPVEETDTDADTDADADEDTNDTGQPSDADNNDEQVDTGEGDDATLIACEAQTREGAAFAEYPDREHALTVAPHSVVELRGILAPTLDASELTLRWSLLEQPDGSFEYINNAFEPSDHQFTAGAVGVFVAQLDVFSAVDESLMHSCQVVVAAEPTSELWVELLWEPPTGEGPWGTGIGSDFDLHLLHSYGSWMEMPWDAYWFNPNPNWGSMNPSVDDDPKIVMDSVDGWGPESIEFNGLADTPIRYRIGVHHYQNHESDSARSPTVRAYADGVLVLESTGPLMEQAEFWEVAEVEQLPTGELVWTTVDLVWTASDLFGP